MINKLTAEKVSQVLPGVSSVASKVLASEIKSSLKVKSAFIELWIGGMLVKFVAQKGTG